MKTEPTTHFETLPNGLGVLLRETHLAPVVNLQIWARVGSADERESEQGLAHFHEHMLFKGTERRGVGEVAGAIEGAGGRVNAYTSFDVTVYYATLPSDALDVGLDVLVDAIRFSRFDPDEIARETEVVLEEIRRSDDSPGHVLGDAVFREAYRVHPYRLPILGPPENVASFDRERVTRFFRQWYAPDNLLFVAAGDFDARDLTARVAEAFEGATPSGVSRSRAVEPPQDGLRTAILTRPFERVRLDLSWAACSFRHEDATPLELLSYILGECDSSRLVRNVKESRGLVDRIDSSCYTPLDPGLFSVNIEVDSDRAGDAIAAAIAEVERLRRSTVSEEELERARTNFLASEHFERESVSGQASKLGSFHVLGGDWRSEKGYLDSIRATTAEDLQRVARRYLGSDQLTVGALLPEGEEAALSADSVARFVGRGVALTERELTPPRRDATTRRSALRPPATRPPEIHSYTLANGAALHVLPRREVPVVAGRAAFLGGLLSEDEDTAGLTSFLSSMWQRGTRNHSTAGFARSVENLAAEIEGFSGRSSLGAVLESTSDKFEPTLDLFAEFLLEPALDLEELERERRDTLAAIDRREDRLAQQAYLLFSRAHFESHPYRLPMIGNRESVSRFDAATLGAHHERLIRAENMVMGLAGDVDPDAAAEAVSARFAAMPAGGFEAPRPAEEAVPSEIRSVELHKDRAQAHLVVGFRGLTVADPDRYALEVICQMLTGQSGRLFLQLRDRQSLAYSVNAVNVEGLAPGFFSVYIATSPEKVDEAREGILAQLDRLVQEAPDEKELTHARRHLVGTAAIDSQRNGSHAAHMALDALYGLGPDASNAYAEAVESITRDDVLRVARRIIDLDAYTIALVCP